MKKVLLFGFGNIGRQDDGLGVRLALHFEENPIEGLSIDSNYQLNIEDAANISSYDEVIFADASLQAQTPFQFEPLLPSSEISFSSHAMHPSSVLALCEDLYKKYPTSYLLTLQGYDWDIGEGLSEKAQEHLKAAIFFITQRFCSHVGQV